MKGSRLLVDRMIRAAKLDVDVYEEVEADTTALRQALVVIVIAALSLGLGTGFGILWDDGGLRFGQALLWGIVMGVLLWLIWSLITYYVGTRLLRGPETRSDYEELLRTIGFSASPGALLILSFIPFIGWLIRLALWAWMLAAMVIGVRQALDFTTRRAIATCIVGFIIMAGLYWGVGAAVDRVRVL